MKIFRTNVWFAHVHVAMALPEKTELCYVASLGWRRWLNHPWTSIGRNLHNSLNSKPDLSSHSTIKSKLALVTGGQNLKHDPCGEPCACTDNSILTIHYACTETNYQQIWCYTMHILSWTKPCFTPTALPLKKTTKSCNNQLYNLGVS